MGKIFVGLRIDEKLFKRIEKEVDKVFSINGTRNRTLIYENLLEEGLKRKKNLL